MRNVNWLLQSPLLASFILLNCALSATLEVAVKATPSVRHHGASHSSRQTAQKLESAQPAAPRQQWAVIVASFPQDHPLRFTSDDARLFRDVTKIPPANCILLSSDAEADTERPTREHILTAVRVVAAKARAGDLFWFYFSGHGYPSSYGKSYLIPEDCQTSQDTTLIPTAISVSELRTALADPHFCRARTKVLVLDACHSGSPKSLTRPSWGGLFDPLPGIVTIAGSSLNRECFELPELKHGIFTYYLARGLAGAGVSSAQPIVTLSDLKNYVVTQVNTACRQRLIPPQEPQFIVQAADQNIPVGTNDPAAQTHLPEPDLHMRTVIRPALPPAVIVAIDESQSNPGVPTGLLSAELRRLIIGRHLPVLSEEMVNQFLFNLPRGAGPRDLNVRPTAEAGELTQTAGARFLLRGHVHTTVLQFPQLPGTMTVQVVADMELIDTDGRVLASETSDSPQGRPAVGAGSSVQTAAARAMHSAAARLFTQLQPAIEAALVQPNSPP